DGEGAVACTIPGGVSQRSGLRGVFVGAALAGWFRLPRVRQGSRGGAEEPGLHLRMLELRSSDFDHGRDGDAPHQAAADDMVLGGTSHGDAFQWHHRVFALLKRWSLGTYHGLRRKHVDTYLNEFVFRYNRRFYRHVSFETVLGLTARHKPPGYWDIIGRANPRKGNATLRRATRRRKTATGMRQDGSDGEQIQSQDQASKSDKPLDMGAPGTTQ